MPTAPVNVTYVCHWVAWPPRQPLEGATEQPGHRRGRRTVAHGHLRPGVGRRWMLGIGEGGSFRALYNNLGPKNLMKYFLLFPFV